MGLVQFLMWTSNIVFWAIGGTMLGVGIWMAVDDSSKNMATVASSAGMNEDLYWAGVYLMISIGAVVVLVGFFGCFGSMNPTERKGMLKMYFIFVKLILLVELISLILVGVFWDSFNQDIQQNMYRDIHNQYNKDDALTEAWDGIQAKWECCGAQNYTDYKNATGFNETVPVPDSCCRWEDDKQNLETCFLEARGNLTTKSQVFDKNCYNAMSDFIDENATIFITITCVFIGLQIFGSFCACLLMRKGN